MRRPVQRKQKNADDLKRISRKGDRPRAERARQTHTQQAASQGEERLSRIETIRTCVRSR